MSVPFLSGKNVKNVFIRDNEKVVLNDSSFEVKPNGVEIADGVNGENRDRLDYIINFYDINVTSFTAKLELVEAFIAEQKDRDTNTIPKDKAVGMVVQCNDGTTKSLVMWGDVTIGNWGLGIRGRTDRVQVTMPIRCQYLDFAPTI